MRRLAVLAATLVSRAGAVTGPYLMDQLATLGVKPVGIAADGDT